MFSYSRFYPHSDFVDLTMFQFGQSKCKPGTTPGYLVYRHYLFHYVFSGKGVLYSEGVDGNIQAFPVEAGQGFLIFPGHRSTYVADKDDPWHYAWIEFDGLKARELIRQTRLQINQPIFASKNEAEKEQMSQAILFMVNHPDNPPMELIAHLYLFANSFAQASVSDKPTFTDGTRDFYVQEAIGFISRNYAKDLSIKDIAEHCSIHRSYLSRIFKASAGVSPQEFLIRCRCDAACELLKTTNYSISEISVMVGYPNPLNFSRAFKREKGLSPREFRK